MVKNIKLGLIGMSEGNGHPYSFSAIINGYDRKSMQASQWDVIYNYLLKCDSEDFLNRKDVAITHLYTQIPHISENLARATKIPHITNSLQELVDSDIDGVIIARDDWQTHQEMAYPFLQAGKFVFIDKPLSLCQKDMDFFTPYLESGKLMSCSGMRYARELDMLRKAILYDEEKILFVEGNIGSAWDRYFIHLLDAIFGLTYFEAKQIKALALQDCTTALITTQDFMIQLNNRNANFMQPCTFVIVTNKNRYELTLSDNFSAFRRMLGKFVRLIEGEKFEYRPTIEAMKILNAIKESFTDNNQWGGGHKLNYCPILSSFQQFDDTNSLAIDSALYPASLAHKACLTEPKHILDILQSEHISSYAHKVA